MSYRGVESGLLVNSLREVVSNEIVIIPVLLPPLATLNSHSYSFFSTISSFLLDVTYPDSFYLVGTASIS